MLHDLFNALLDLLRSLFGMPTPANPAGHGGNDCDEIINEIMLGVAWKHHFQGTSWGGCFREKVSDDDGTRVELISIKPPCFPPTKSRFVADVHLYRVLAQSH